MIDILSASHFVLFYLFSNPKQLQANSFLSFFSSAGAFFPKLLPLDLPLSSFWLAAALLTFATVCFSAS